MTAFEDSRRIEGREMSTSGYWSRLRSRNLSRRALLRASARAGVGAAGLALVGCGDDDDDDDDVPSAVQAERQQQEEQDQPARQQAQQQQQQQAAAQVEQQAEQQAERQAAAQDQQEQQAETAETETAREEAAASEVDLDAEIIVGYGSFPPTLDVSTAGGGGGQAASNNLHFAQLSAKSQGRQNLPTGGFGGWEFAENNSIFRYTIKQGVTFHNGEPLNAESVKFYFDRILGRAEYNPDFQSHLNARASWMGDIRIIDDYTVEIAMDTPFVDAAEQSGGINFAVTAHAVHHRKRRRPLRQQPGRIRRLQVHFLDSRRRDPQRALRRVRVWARRRAPVHARLGQAHHRALLPPRSRPAPPRWRRARSISLTGSARTWPASSRTARTSR